MILLIYIFAVAWFANLFTWGFTLNVFEKFKEEYLNYKIFNCTKCFAFWLSLVIGLFIFKGIILNLLMSLVISFVANVIEEKYIKY